MGDRARWSDPKYNPCIDEANASYKCLDRNNYNRDACTAYFEAYKGCRKKMLKAKREGRPFIKETKEQPS